MIDVLVIKNLEETSVVPVMWDTATHRLADISTEEMPIRVAQDYQRG